MNVTILSTRFPAIVLSNIGKTTVKAILESQGINIDYEKDVITLNQTTLSNTGLELEVDQDCRITISRCTRAEAPTPKVKSAIKFLKNQGYTQRPGKGDHLVFNYPNSKPIVINPDKRDKKHIDLGSAKKMAEVFGESLHTLYEKIK